MFPLALAADALRRSGATRVILVAPYLPYMRQDIVFAPGQPISQRVLARFLATSFDRVVTVDAHLHRTTSLGELFAPVPADDIASTPALAEWINSNGPPPDLIVGPDEESEPWVRAIGEAIGAPWMTMQKVRRGDATVEVTLGQDELQVAHGRVLLVDDICSSGGTLSQAITVLKRAGAADILVYVTHALFGADVEASLRAAGAKLVVSSDSVPHRSNAIALCDVLPRQPFANRMIRSPGEMARPRRR